MDRRVIGGLVVAGVAGVVAAVVLSPRLRQGARETLALPGPAPDSLKSAALTSAQNVVNLAEGFEPQLVDTVAGVLAQIDGQPEKAHDPEVRQRAEKLVRDGLSQVSGWLAGQKSVQSSAKNLDEAGAGHA